MSRVELLYDVIDDIRTLGNSLQVLADAIASDESTKYKPIKKTTKAKSSSTGANAVNAEEKPVTLEDVRKVMAEKSRAGFTEEVKAIITKHGVDRLSDIKPSEFASVLAETEVLCNG